MTPWRCCLLPLPFQGSKGLLLPGILGVAVRQATAGVQVGPLFACKSLSGHQVWTRGTEGDPTLVGSKPGV